LNDATTEDARVAGLIDLVEVIDNGDDAPGTILETCSVAFQHHFGAADLVIVKGQGNYESLSGVDKNIFFMLKAKCPVIAEHLGCKLNQMILRRSDAFTGAGNFVKGGKVDAWV
ncbi:ARMT1-like domain-containing protein, partial [Planctomycetota bacterium]